MDSGMRRLGRHEPLPGQMQGRWVDLEESSSVLTVSDGEITWRGEPVEYEHKEIREEDGAFAVNLGTEDEKYGDPFERASILRLILTPDGELYAYNMRFAVQLVRA